MAPKPSKVEVIETAPKGDGVSATLRSFQGDWPSTPGIATLYDSWCRSAKEHASKPCLGKRAVGADGKAGGYVFETYAEVDAKVQKMAGFYTSVGAAALTRVGVFGVNCPEWVIAMHACSRQSMYCVPLYDTLGADAVEYILNHAEISIVVVQAAKLPALLEALPKAKGIKTVIVWGGDVPESDALEGKTVVTFDEALTKGAATPCEPVPPKADDLCTIMYTSGTTGEPKGVMLTHSGIVSACEGVIKHSKAMGFALSPNDRYLSYLPLAHIFDRAVEETWFMIGGCVGFWRGDTRMLVDDIKAFKPTVFCGVPRIFDRIYTAGMGALAEKGAISKAIFDLAFKTKIKYLRKGYAYDKAAPIFDSILFNKTKAGLGGNVRYIISGAAPLASHVEDFLSVTMCCPVVQGYGLTETSAASFIGVIGSTPVGSVGVPLPSCEFRLESVPEMKYDATASPAKGEVCIRGPGLFTGYYKKQDITDEVVDKDGWFHTGDIGECLPGGQLKIIDRKKNIFKLAQGEYVAVEKVEAALGATPGVANLWVYGDSFQTFLVAIVVPVEAALKKWAAEKGISGDFKELCGNAEACAYFLEAMQAVGKEKKLKGFEQVKKLVLEPNDFSMDNDLLTPSFKKKRPQLKAFYQAQIDEMYKA